MVFIYSSWCVYSRIKDFDKFFKRETGFAYAGGRTRPVGFTNEVGSSSVAGSNEISTVAPFLNERYVRSG